MFYQLLWRTADTLWPLCGGDDSVMGDLPGGAVKSRRDEREDSQQGSEEARDATRGERNGRDEEREGGRRRCGVRW